MKLISKSRENFVIRTHGRVKYFWEGVHPTLPAHRKKLALVRIGGFNKISTLRHREININKLFIIFYTSGLDNRAKIVYIIGVRVST